MILKCESCIESRNFPTFFDWLLFIPGPRPLMCTSGHQIYKKHVSMEGFLLLVLKNKFTALNIPRDSSYGMQ